MTTEVTIDLGLDRSPPEERESLRDVWRRWARWRRPVGLAVCAVLLSTLTAAAIPLAPRLTLVARHGQGGFLVSGDYLVIDSPDGTSSVHRLPTGERLWRGRGLYPADEPGVFYAISCPDGVGCDQPVRVAYDAATGARLGPVPDEPWLPGTRLQLVAHGDLQVEAGDGRVAADLARRVEVRDASGALRWSVESPDGLGVVRIQADPPAVVVYDRRSVTVRDAVTGEVRRRYRPADPGRWIFAASVVGDLLLVDTVGGDHDAVHALDLATLTERWRRRSGRDGWLAPCGELLCLRRYRGYGRVVTSVLDPGTGEELWSTRGGIQAVGDRFLVRPVEETASTGRLGDTRVVAPRTGETLVDLAGWTAVGTGDDGTVVLTALTSAGTAVALLGPDDTAPRFVGTAHRAFWYCVPFDGGLVCDSGTGISVWTYRRSWAGR